MFTSIFVESSESLGILYDRYKNLPNKIKDFMDLLDDVLDKVRDVDVLEEDVIKINQELERFKHAIELNLNNPDSINSDDLKGTKNDIQSIKNISISFLDRLGVMRRKYRFGDNWIKGILIKPKIYKNSINEEDQILVNQMVRSIGRALDWIEKINLDLMNLADQDLNILSLVQKVYFRKIYEAPKEDFSNILDAPISENTEDLYESYFANASEDNHAEEDDKDSILNAKINSNQEFYPVYSIVTSYDPDRMDNLTELQARMIDRGKMIGAVTRGDKYTHTLISFDTTLENMFHFMGTGFQPDNILENPAFDVTQSIYINCTFVTKEERRLIFDEIKRYSENKSETKYDMLQLIDQLIGKPIHHDKRMICSTFVGYLLSCGNAKNLHRDYSFIRPEDITILPRSFYVINFRNKEDFINRKGEFDRRIAKVYRDNIDEIRDYNNILPKVLLKTKFKEMNSFEKFFDWFISKFKITA